MHGQLAPMGAQWFWRGGSQWNVYPMGDLIEHAYQTSRSKPFRVDAKRMIDFITMSQVREAPGHRGTVRWTGVAGLAPFPQRTTRLDPWRQVSEGVNTRPVRRTVGDVPDAGPVTMSRHVLVEGHGSLGIVIAAHTSFAEGAPPPGVNPLDLKCERCPSARARCSCGCSSCTGKEGGMRSSQGPRVGANGARAS